MKFLIVSGILHCMLYSPMYSVFLFFFLQTEMLSLPPDNRIVAKVRDIVIQDGIKSVSEMKMLLETFVRSSIFQDRTLPSASNRRFYPTDKDIHSTIYRYDITFATYALHNFLSSSTQASPGNFGGVSSCSPCLSGKGICCPCKADLYTTKTFTKTKLI